MASVTESAATRRCRWCGREFPITPGPGRPKLFCKAACRQADYLARQRSAEAGISEAEPILTRAAPDERRDKLYVPDAALADGDADLAAAGREEALRAPRACRPRRA